MKNIFKNGDAYVWLSGVALMFSLLMITGLLFLIAFKGLGFFWPSDVVKLTMKDGSLYMGQYSGREVIPDMSADAGLGEIKKEYRIQLKVGNRDVYGADFKWFDVDNIEDRSYPPEAIILERREWGNFIGFLKEIKTDGKSITAENDEAFRNLKNQIDEAREIQEQIDYIEKKKIGDINYRIEQLRLDIKARQLELVENEKGEKLEELEKGGTNQDEQTLKAVEEKIAGKKDKRIAELRRQVEKERKKYRELEKQLVKLYSERDRNEAILETVEGEEEVIPVGQIIRAFKPNSMGFLDKSAHYFSKVWEFVSEDPREANTEGGIFPAIFGTVMMVFIMSIVVMPFGVLAALYLREYAKQGTMVRIVRICVNNLAGVPSIVYGVFGVGFFIYGVGGLIDAVFFREALPNPTFGTGGILWASLTLALLTLPVVIVATEEGLAAVPRDIREGSLALGATKFETIWKVVIPSSLPAIMTGLILAIARAAGEVAPLMITGVVKLAPELPIDGRFPFIHLERKFMHMGFHIYDVGFQSPNVEAAKPMVFTTALLLIMIVVTLNLTAIIIRNRLKKKYSTGSGV